MISRAISMLSALTVFSAFALADSYTFATIDIPGAYNTELLGINDLGQIVGGYNDNAGNHAFVDNNGVITTINVPNALYTVQASGINDSGEIVGYYESTTGAHGFVDTDGIFTTLNAHPTTIPYGINNLGQIVGQYFDGTGPFYGFVDTNGVFTTLSGPDSPNTLASGINNLGEVVGTYAIYHGQLGFVDQGTLTVFNGPGATPAAPAGINDLGEIVGTYSVGGFLDINGVFTALSDPVSSEGTFPSGINNSGVIVGQYRDSAGYSHGFVATPTPTNTPEPDTLGSILLGCLFFLPAGLRRHHRRSA